MMWRLRLQGVQIFLNFSPKWSSGDISIAILTVLWTSLISSPFLQLFLGKRFIGTEQIAMLNLSSTFRSVVSEQDHIYPNTLGKDKPNLLMP